MPENQMKNIWDIDNIPNRLTIFRMVLIPFIIGGLSFVMIDSSWATGLHSFFGYLAAVTFIVASITDFLDGYFARKRNLVTVFGSFLDPIADKFLVVSSLIMLQALGRIHPLVVIVLVLREFYMTSLRLLARDHNLSVPVGQWGKWKTTTQMIGIPFLMVNTTIEGLSVGLIGTGLIYLSTFLSLFSAGQYTFGLFQKFREVRGKHLATNNKEKDQDKQA